MHKTHGKLLQNLRTVTQFLDIPDGRMEGCSDESGPSILRMTQRGDLEQETVTQHGKGSHTSDSLGYPTLSKDLVP